MFSGRRSSGPPSRESEIWILVSLVERLMDAVRRETVMVETGGLRGLGGVLYYYCFYYTYYYFVQ